MQRKKNKNQIKLIGGKWRSRFISFPSIKDIRPTPIRVRETIFNWLRDEIVDANCLDAFAGSGSLGFESLSRGAKEVYFIDNEKDIVISIKDYSKLLDANAKIILGDTRSILENKVLKKFNIIFVDPPYSYPLLPILNILPKWLTRTGYVYVEREKRKTKESFFYDNSDLLNKYELIKFSISSKVEYGLLKYSKST